MTPLLRITPMCQESSAVDVVFIHGLGGDRIDTWQTKGKDDSFWPTWLARDDSDCTVYSLGFDANPSNWLGHSMPIVDRSTNLLAVLEAEDFGNRQIVFIVHSLGGLILKQMLRTAVTYGGMSWQRIADQTRGVVFLSTPHSGARVADYINSLRRIFRLTISVRELEDNSAPLRDLNLWFRNNAAKLHIETRVFFETRDTMGFRVVDEASADPGMPGVIPIPVDANHFEICKPDDSHSSIVVRLSSRLISEIVSGSEQSDDQKVAARVKALHNASLSDNERDAMARLLTFLEDKRLLTNQTGYQWHKPTHLRVSAAEIRRKVNDALQDIGRASKLAPILTKLQDAARNFQEKTEGATFGIGLTPELPEEMTFEDYLASLEEFRRKMIEAISEAATLANFVVNPALLAAFEAGQRKLQDMIPNRKRKQESVQSPSKDGSIL